MSQDSSQIGSIEERVKKIIMEKLEVAEDEVTAESSIRDDLGGDSLEITDIVMEIEEVFDIEIPTEDAEKIQTIQETIDYIRSRIK